LFFDVVATSCQNLPTGWFDWQNMSVPSRFVIATPLISGRSYLVDQPLETLFQAVAGQRGAGMHAARSPCVAASRAQGVRAPAEVAVRRRAVGLVGEDEQGKVRSAADQRVVGHQSPQLDESHRQPLLVRTVDDVYDAVTLTQVVLPQVPVATLLQPNSTNSPHINSATSCPVSFAINPRALYEINKGKGTGSWICIAPHCEQLTSEALRYRSHSCYTANSPYLPLPRSIPVY